MNKSSDQFIADHKAEQELNNRLLLLFRNNSYRLKKILKWITSVLEEDDIEITDIHIATCMQQFGLHLKNFREYFYIDDDAKTFIEKISSLMREKNLRVHAWSLGATMQGLVDLEDNKESRSIVGSLANSIKHYQPTLDSKCIGRSLYSLQNHQESVEVIEFVKNLINLAQRDNVKLNAYSVSVALFGLQNIIHLYELTEAHDYLINQLNQLKLSEIGEITLITLIQSLHIAKIDIPKTIQDAYQQYIDINEHQGFQSDSEKTAFNIIKERFPNQIVTHNQFVDGFELDIYMPNLKLNIEIDGKQHRENSIREDKRDEYLIQEHGITILRIPSNIVRNKKEFIQRVIKTYGVI